MPVTPNSTKRKPFNRYAEYVARLRGLLNDSAPKFDRDAQIVAALNGEASVELRRVISLKIRRKYGAYFTGTVLSKRLLEKCSSFRSSRTFFYDASCGMGDLLLAAANKLSLSKTLPETLTQWGHKLAGTDLHQEFIRGAKTRLALLACKRHKAKMFVGLPDKYFPHIRVANGLAQKKAFQRATTILLNPPFGIVDSPIDCDWAGGRFSEAATFVITALELCRPGTEVLAILPEVLRSGSFSKLWRNRVSELAEIHLIEPYGIFDESADIDVFLLRLIRRTEGELKKNKKWPIRRNTRNTRVADFFHVHVGRVVPHRDKKAGPRHPYIHPRCVPTWTVMKEFSETRKHEGLVYKPPFVALRRTSRPGHPYRATATVIAGKLPVAVENHLIVCEPKDGKLKTCKELMLQLKTEAVNKYLDARIRCRHLTVGAVEAIPFTLT